MSDGAKKLVVMGTGTDLVSVEVVFIREGIDSLVLAIRDLVELVKHITPVRTPAAAGDGDRAERSSPTNPSTTQLGNGIISKTREPLDQLDSHYEIQPIERLEQEMAAELERIKARLTFLEASRDRIDTTVRELEHAQHEDHQQIGRILHRLEALERNRDGIAKQGNPLDALAREVTQLEKAVAEEIGTEAP